MLRVAIMLAGLVAAISGPAPATAQSAAALVQSLEPGAASSGSKPPGPASPPVLAPSVSPAQARDILETLNDPKKRAAFVATLEAISKALPPAAPQPVAASPASPDQAPAGQQPANAAAPAPAADTKLQLKPDSLGARLLVSASDVLAEASAHAEEAVIAMNSLPALLSWVRVITTDPWGRQMLSDTAWRLVVVFGAGLLAQYAVSLLIRRPRAALETIGARHAASDVEPVSDTASPEVMLTALDTAADAAPAIVGGVGLDATTSDDSTTPMPAKGASIEHVLAAPDGGGRRRRRWKVSAAGMLRRLPLTGARLLLDLLPVVAFVVAAHLALSTPIGGEMHPRLVLIALVGAYAACLAILCVLRSLFAPAASGLRLFDISDETAAYVMRWSRRLVVVTVFGYAIGEAGRLLGLSDAARDALMKVVGIVDHTFLAIIVLQKRRAVRDWLRAPEGRDGVWAQFRNRFAAIWHWVALFYIVAFWLIWAVEIPNGFSMLLRLFVATSLTLALMRIVLILLRGALDRLITPSDETLARYPGLQRRLRLWRPVLHVMLDLIVYLVTLVQLLQVWGFGALAWLTGTDLGHHVLAALTSVLVTLAVAMLVWEMANHWADRQLARLARDAQVARAARLRTLLPMLRTTLSVVILSVVAMLVLSEIGVNTAPLLAGAGVLGIAIGFGSQKLVQDIITGLFLLVENTMQVGDVVSLGGLSGTVEDLSVRAIRLRAEDGSVHVIPFSAVSTVTNMTRDFGHAVIEVGVAYKEDYDKVVAVMRAIVADMRTEPRWEGEIRDEMEVMGLNAFADSSVMIKARIKCGPFGRWSVLREFNRRLKARFEAEGIEIPYPHQELVVNQAIKVAGHTPAASAGSTVSSLPHTVVEMPGPPQPQAVTR